MSTFRQISADFVNFSTSMKSSISSVLFKEGSALLSDFQSRAPVDSGSFKHNWKLSRNRFSSGNTIVSISLYNATPYAVFMEYGAEQNKAPWFFSESKKKKSGKLAVINGRVWAGGLNPGHSDTVRGAIRPVLFDNKKRINQLVTNIADAVIGGLK